MATMIKDTPINGAVIGKIFKANERAEFSSLLKQATAQGLRVEARIRLGNGGKFAGALLAIDCGGKQCDR